MTTFPVAMASQKTERSLETLKEKLWEQFEKACQDLKDGWDSETRRSAQKAVGLIGQALVDAYREEREAQGSGTGRGLKS